MLRSRFPCSELCDLYQHNRCERTIAVIWENQDIYWTCSEVSGRTVKKALIVFLPFDKTLLLALRTFLEQVNVRSL